MLKNYLIVATRNLLKHRAYSAINIAGLAIGMACCILMLLYVQHSLSYDRFHKDRDRIYRLMRQMEVPGQDPTFHASVSGAIAQILEEGVPEVEVATRVWLNNYEWIRYGETILEPAVRLVEPSFFEVFDFPLVKGDPSSVFDEPYSAVITEWMVRTYFGDEDPLGKRFEVTSGQNFIGSFIVTGVVRDAPSTSSLNFEFLTATVQQRTERAWNGWIRGRGGPVGIYIKVRPGSDLNTLKTTINQVIGRSEPARPNRQNTYHLQPLTRIHLYNHADYGWGAPTLSRVYTVSSLAIIILLVACVNFMTLSTARSGNRSREVGMRKVAGAYRTHLILQFLGESILLSGFALILAIGIVQLSLPTFNEMMYRNLSLLDRGGEILILLAAVTVAVGLLAGSYPALYLSGFQPASVLKGSGAGRRGGKMRAGLVIIQFGISIFFLIGTIVVDGQMAFLKSRPLGYERNHLVVLPIFSLDHSSGRDPEKRLMSRYRAVKQSFLEHPNVLRASATATRLPWRDDGARVSVIEEGLPEEVRQMRYHHVDADFLRTLQIDLVAGRNLPDRDPGDSHLAFVINETAVRTMGWENSIGRRIVLGDGHRSGEIVGVVKDFQTGSAGTRTSPIVLSTDFYRINVLLMRIRGENIPETIEFLESRWQHYLPERPFQFTFLDDRIDQVYRNEYRFGKLFSIAALLAVLISCMGLLGLAAFTTEQRTKEVGIRKVLGASVTSIVILLSGSYLKLILVANVLAWPAAYVVMDRWLQDFDFRVSLSLSPFLLAAILAITLGLLAVSSQVLKSRSTDPVDVLNYE